LGIIAPTHTRTYRRLVDGTTINGTTLLSTDYLNHFNEIVMMLELAVEMPDILAEMDAWQPKTYAQHFLDSGFSHKELAVAAYDHAPMEYRGPFDRTIAEIAGMVAEAAPRARALLASADREAAGHEVLAMTGKIRHMIERASAIINGARVEDLDAGRDRVMEQSDIDALFA
jgi:hypothetical protein